jgi:glycosyltransferase involved in cell wall biosynthesis
MDAHPLFSVTIPVKNNRAYLPELLNTLSSLQSPSGGYEVVFVDDRSSDGSYEYLVEAAASRERFRVVRGPGVGPAAARNVGIRHARGRYLAFCDGDTLPDVNWLAEAAEALNGSKARAMEGAIVPWSDSETGPLVRNVRNEDGGRYMTANMFYERALLDQVGGFDEAFGLPHFLEDSDLAFRVMDLGVAIPFFPQVRVRHREIIVRPGGLLRDQVKLHWVPLLARKHPQRFRSQLRPKVQTFRPGDVDYLLALALVVATRRSSPVVRGLAMMALAVALRRVVSVAAIRRLPDRRLSWLGAVLLMPAVRVGSIAAGWVRFRKIAF